MKKNGYGVDAKETTSRLKSYRSIKHTIVTEGQKVRPFQPDRDRR